MSDRLNPAEHFDRKRAEVYDTRVQHLIPGYSVIQSLSKSLLESCLPTSAEVLVAGAGTGNEAVSLASNNPGWKITGFDPSPEMIKVAKSKVEKRELAGRIFLFEGFAHRIEEKTLFDAATSILVMHFLPDDGSKDDFACEISKRLKPEAKFVLVDLEGDPASADFKMLFSAWRRHLLSAVEDEEQVDETMGNIMKNVKFTPENRIREILQNAGFKKVVKFCQSCLAGGYSAVKI